jgi:uncharacterized protein (DUF2147 family)
MKKLYVKQNTKKTKISVLLCMKSVFFLLVCWSDNDIYNEKIKLKKLKLSIFLTGFFLFSTFSLSISANTHSIVGYWQTSDKETQQPAAVIEVTQHGGFFSGKIVKLYEKPNAICKKCTGDLNGQPLLGMEVVSNFGRSGDQWKKGNVLSVERGKRYPAVLTLSADANALNIEVKAGFATHKETWKRVSAP